MINPSDFQTAGLAWVTAITLVGLGVIKAIGQLLGEVKVIRERLNSHDNRITNNANKITDVAAAVPPVVPSAPAPGTQTDSMTVTETTTSGG